MAKAVPEELINAYDNTILYTDYLVNNVIESLKQIESRNSCVIFISDHGESLGENNLYMHGVPMAMAPREQVEIPFIVWTSNNSKIKSIDTATQYHIFHSTMDFLDIESEVYDSSLTIFE
jgi:lipid A ethanolaminephosphotransferase